MSAITKLFVVLMVVCGLLSAAAMVVFVNRVEDYHAMADAAKQDAQLAQSRIAAAEAETAKSNQDVLTANNALNALRTKDQETISGLQGQIAKLTADADAAKQTIASKDGQIAALAQAVQAGEENNKGLQASLADARKTTDDSITKLRDLNVEVSNLTSQNDSLRKQNDFLTEQHAEAEHTMQQMQNAMKVNNISINPDGTVQGPSGVAVAPAGPINGVIKETTMMHGNKYATISVGSADNVQKGMKFYVVTRNGQFLGVMTIQSVEPTEAVGRIEGDKVELVRGGEEVKTQL